jgi:hypothetical protein
MATQNLSEKINALAVKAVVVLIVCAIPALFLPLDAPGATQEQAAVWLMNTMSAYMLGWIVQIIAMFSLTIIFAGAAWQIFEASPIRAVTIWLLTSFSVVVFLITKFIAIWTVPLMAKALAAGSAESEVAQVFLTALAPSVSFGLAPSLDYLGFWLYALIGLLLFRPLFALSASAKVAAVTLLLFGVIFHLVFVAIYLSLVSQGDIPAIIESSGVLLLVASIALFFQFRAQRG